MATNPTRLLPIVVEVVDILALCKTLRILLSVWGLTFCCALSTHGCAIERVEVEDGQGSVSQAPVDVWDELCAAATIEDDCSDSLSCYGTQAVIPQDLYCQHYECPIDLAAYEERFTTCASSPAEWPRCGWERLVGCGVVQFIKPHDESSFHAIAFDEAEGTLLGFLHSSDSSLQRCEVFDFRVGTFSDYFHRREPACDDVRTERCCHRDAPNLW